LPRLRKIFKDKHLAVRVFGVDFDEDLHAWIDDPSQAREFTSDFWHSPPLIKELEKETSESDRQNVRALRLLRHAYTVDDEDAAREILDKVRALCAFPETLSNEPSWS